MSEQRYKRLDLMTDEEIQWNVDRLRKGNEAQQHAELLLTYLNDRRQGRIELEFRLES